MPLVTQKKPNLSGGVNQQAAVHRHSTQVEEMINCIPTLDAGLRLRNPTAPIPIYDLDGIVSKIRFPAKGTSAFVYEHDRGTLVGRDTELAFIVAESYVNEDTPVEDQRQIGLEIVDLTLKQEMDDQGQEVLAGEIYKDGNGINYVGDAKLYLENNFGAFDSNNFAMVTVKDTTFIVNKTKAPKMLTTRQSSINPTLDYGNAKITYNSITGDHAGSVTGSSGSFSFEVPEDVYNVKIEYGAAGGSGGGGAGGNEQDWSDATGGHGGYGGYAGQTSTLPQVKVAFGDTHAITIGNAAGGGAGGGQGSGDSHPSGIAGAKGGDTSMVLTGVDTLTGGAAGEAGTGSSDRDAGGDGESGDGSPFGNGGIGGVGAEDKNGTYGVSGGFSSGGGGGGGGGTGDTAGEDGKFGGYGGASGEAFMNMSWTSVTADSTDHLRSGYVWIKSASVVTSGYAYSCTINIIDDLGDPVVVNTTPTVPDLEGTIKGATNLAAAIEAALLAHPTDFTGTEVSPLGSMVRISLPFKADGTYMQIKSVEAEDTYGNTASFGWGHNVDTLADLPKSMADFNPVVEVGSDREATYWLNYREGVWRESKNPDVFTALDASTMPHVIVKRLNSATERYEFYVEEYKWDRREVGDDNTNKIPSFATFDSEFGDVFIKDIFFFRNRLGVITADSIVLTEVGEYGNFFRTSVAALLDGDRIDADVESFGAVNLEFSVLLEDSVILFADKAQYRFSGGDILSSASYKVQQEMAYDVNTRVRPLFMNDRIFFVAERGKNSAVYEMTISNNSGQNSEANDLTAHCQTYIDARIDKLTGSPTNNMLFLTSETKYSLLDGNFARNTVFTYKYYNDGRTRHQSAWSKWTFDGDLITGFAMGKNFYLLLDRTDAITEEDWIMSTGQWRMNQPWKMAGRWIMSPDSLKTFKQFERLAIHPKDEAGIFLDNYVTPIDGYVALGEYVYGKDGNKDIRGRVQMKTIEIDMSTTSLLEIWVADRQRGTIRTIPSKLNKGRKPMMYGDSKNIRTGFRNEGDRGFRVEMVSFESRVNKRAKAH